MRRDQWDEVSSRVADAARSLQAGGADMVLLCSNTNHQCADAVEAAVTLPLVHIVDPTADAVEQANIRRVGLLGTRYTMERRFLRDRLEARGPEVIVPGEPDRTTIHDIQFKELVFAALGALWRPFLQAVVFADRDAYLKVLAARLALELVDSHDFPPPTSAHHRQRSSASLTPTLRQHPRLSARTFTANRGSFKVPRLQAKRQDVVHPVNLSIRSCEGGGRSL